MRDEGKTRKEIAESLCLEKRQLKDWVRRYNRQQKLQQVGIVPRHQGRPSKELVSSDRGKDYEIKRLKMENELLRDFLQIAGKR